MHRDDEELSVRVEQASKELNLKLHPCGTKNVMMAACVDIEGSLILILRIILIILISSFTFLNYHHLDILILHNYLILISSSIFLNSMF